MNVKEEIILDVVRKRYPACRFDVRNFNDDDALFCCVITDANGGNYERAISFLVLDTDEVVTRIQGNPEASDVVEAFERDYPWAACGAQGYVNATMGSFNQWWCFQVTYHGIGGHTHVYEYDAQ